MTYYLIGIHEPRKPYNRYQKDTISFRTRVLNRSLGKDNYAVTHFYNKDLSWCSGSILDAFTGSNPVIAVENKEQIVALKLLPVDTYAKYGHTSVCSLYECTVEILKVSDELLKDVADLKARYEYYERKRFELDRLSSMAKMDRYEIATKLMKSDEVNLDNENNNTILISEEYHPFLDRLRRLQSLLKVADKEILEQEDEIKKIKNQIRNEATERVLANYNGVYSGRG